MQFFYGFELENETGFPAWATRLHFCGQATCRDKSPVLFKY